MPLTRIVNYFSWQRLKATHKVSVSFNAVRTYRRHKWAYERELYHRRMLEGPVKEIPRSKKLNWNEDVELYAFTHRISEEISRPALKQAFTDPSGEMVIKKQIAESIDLEVDDVMLNNQPLAVNGREICEEYIERYLRGQMPNLPAEGIIALRKFLMSGEKLAHVGRHMGIADLVLYDGFPVPDGAVAQALLALVFVIKEEKDLNQAHTFIRDFIITQLIGEDIDNVYPIQDAMAKLAKSLADSGKGEPVPRLIDQFGQNTRVSCYYVGIYSDEELIGKGETLDIAKDMAARDALMTVYGIQDHRLPLDFNITYRQAVGNATPNAPIS